MPVTLGPLGTLLLSLLTLILAGLSIWQQYRYRTLERALQALKAAESALHITETEMGVYKQRAERQTLELADANQKIGELQAKTDLSGVLTMLSETIALTRESVDLSRKFDRENSQSNILIVRALEKHGESDREMYAGFSEALKTVAETLIEVKDEVIEHRKDAHLMSEELKKAIKRGPQERTKQAD